MATSMMIRVGLTAEEWNRIRSLAVAHDVSAKKLVTDAIRESLLKGAKP